MNTTTIETQKAARGARRWTWIARSVGVLFVLAFLASYGLIAFSNIALRAENAATAQRLDEERATSKALYEQLLALDEKPVAEPGDSTPASGPAGPTGPQGIQGVPGDKGDTGDPGTSAAPVTSDQIAVAVASYCAANNGCRGPAGADGRDGIDGAPGAPGAAGTPGSPGVSVVAVACIVREDLSTAFQFTLSDGMLLDVSGACTPSLP